MKKIFLSILCLVTVVNLFATIRTVSNNPATIAQYSTIQAAITASNVSGDTIYVHGSTTDYAAFTLTNKSLVIIGPGSYPNSSRLPSVLRANVAGCTISGVASSASEIHGLVIVTGNITISAPMPTDLKFYRNVFIIINIIINGATSGYIFENNYFFETTIQGNGVSGAYSNFIFQNNFIPRSLTTGQFISFVNPVNFIINHNLWAMYSPGGNSSSQGDCFSNCSGLIIINNIFVRRNASNGNSSSTFQNNITFYPAPGPAAPAAPWTLNGNSDGGGNIHHTDPQMVDETLVNNGSGSYLTNFTIPAGPANNTGSDGKDMGLLFNLPPDPRPDLHWVNGLTSRIPYLFNMVITNPVIGAGGTLIINVEARKNN